MTKYLLSACLLLPALPANAAMSACVTELRGAVDMRKAGEKGWSPAAKGSPVGEGDSIRTGKDAWCELLFRDGSFVKLDGGSETSVDELNLTEDGRSLGFSLLKGKALWMAARLKTAALSKFSVRTPSAVCAVRGTDFTVMVSTGGESSVGLFEGSLAFSGAGVEKMLSPGWEASSGSSGPAVRERLSRLMEAERRRCGKLKARVEALRKRLREREDFIDDYSARQGAKVSGLEQRRGEKLERLKKNR